MTAIGAFSPLGPTWEQTCASIRGGLNRFADHPYYEPITPDPGWDAADPLRCSMVPEWQEALDEPRRIVDLAMEALRDLLGRVSLQSQHLARGGLLLALPAERDFPGALDSVNGVVAQLTERTGLDRLARAEGRAAGHAGFFSLLGEAASRIHSGELDFCFVGGVDSYFVDTRLDALDQDWRLKTGRNPDGFLPGEAAVILLLTVPRLAAALGTTPLCLLGEVGLGQEPESITGKRASSGTGLAKAISSVIGRGAPPAWVLCDLNGESYRAFEWGLTQTRLAPLFDGVKRLAHPADCVGDVGAATGPLLIASVAHGLARGGAPAGPALLWSSSDDGTRAALVVNAAAPQKR